MMKAEPSTAATAARTGQETDSALRIVTDEFPLVIKSSGGTGNNPRAGPNRYALTQIFHK
jgi:hypothetical protein